MAALFFSRNDQLPAKPSLQLDPAICRPAAEASKSAKRAAGRSELPKTARAHVANRAVVIDVIEQIVDEQTDV